MAACVPQRGGRPPPVRALRPVPISKPQPAAPDWPSSRSPSARDGAGVSFYLHLKRDRSFFEGRGTTDDMPDDGGRTTDDGEQPSSESPSSVVRRPRVCSLSGSGMPCEG